MARIPYRIGELVYPTKKAAGDAIRLVLYRYQPGQTLSGTDADFIAGVLANHPEVDAKVGCGVASFQVENNGGTQGFWLTRIDGSRTDFSFLSCLTPPSPEQEARAGLRTEIRDQVVAFRDKTFASSWSVACPLTGEHLTVATTHIDHYDPSFLELVDRFLAARSMCLADVAVQPTRDGSTETRLADAVLAAAWQGFHASNARLRAVSQQANLSLLRRGVPRRG